MLRLCPMLLSSIRMLAAMLFFLGLHVSIAGAHASLNATSPVDGAVVDAAPASLSLTFSEPVSPLFLRLVRPDRSVFDLSDFEVRGNRVEIAAPADLERGTHVLTWRVVSADGHPIGGSVVFSIGEISGAAPVVEEGADGIVRFGLWMTKVLLYVGFFIGAGGAFAVGWLTTQSRAGARVAAVAACVGLISTFLSLGFQGLDALGAPWTRLLDTVVWIAGLETSYGATVAAMLAALLMALFALLAESQAVARGLSAAGLLTGGVALVLSGHASAAEPQWLTRPAVFAHAVTIAFWVGALGPLSVALRRGTSDATLALRRFSVAIPWAIVLLVAAGSALVVVQVETPSALVDTAYGRLLLAKLGLLIALFAFGGYNRWRLTRPAERGEPRARVVMVRSIMTEALLALVIFGIAAGWRFTPPPRSLASAAAQPAQVHIHTAQAMADVAVLPGRAGPVSLSVVLMTGEFGSLDAQEVTVVLSNEEAGIGEISRRADRPGDGTWRVDNVVLPLPGTWTLRIEILINDFEMTTLEGVVELRR